MNRKDVYFTHSGACIVIDDIRSRKNSDITIDDVYYHLSNVVRFGGALDDKSWTVGKHSVALALYVKQIGRTDLIVPALLHDCSEFCTGGDMPTPIKTLFENDAYRKVEHQIRDHIIRSIMSDNHMAADYVIGLCDDPTLKMLDTQLAHNEAVLFFKDYIPEWVDLTAQNSDMKACIKKANKDPQIFMSLYHQGRGRRHTEENATNVVHGSPTDGVCYDKIIDKKCSTCRYQKRFFMEEPCAGCYHYKNWTPKR